MAANLLRIATHEAENQLALSLRQAFLLLESNLRPPFPLTIPTSEEYQVTNELLEKLVDSARNQLLWVTGEMVDVSAVGFDALLVSLLRQVVGGDFTDGNLWLCFEVATLFLSKWDSLLEEEPMVLTSGLYAFLRLLADHCRVSSRNSKLEALVRLEIEFCLKMLREQFHLCLKVGRDVIRLLQDLHHMPEFQAVWRDLVLNPTVFGTSGFLGIAQFYSTRTSSRYFLLRIPPMMETHLRFLLTQVKLGGQKRHQAWFASKYLFSPDRETLICDIVRFICCTHHPTKEIIQSDIIPRWAVIGWLLKFCRKNYVEANAKLALFYNWLFFDERADKLMDIEPAVLLMVCSVPKYVEITNSLLEFLFLLVDNYDMEHKEMITRGVLSSFNCLISKGVIHTFDVLTSSGVIFPLLRERLATFLLGMKAGIAKELRPIGVSNQCLPALKFPNSSCIGTPTPSPKKQQMGVQESQIGSNSIDSVAHPRTLIEDLGSLVQNLVEAIKKSDEAGLSILQKILDLYVSIENLPASGPNSVRSLSAKISKDLEHKLFTPVQCFLDERYSGTEVESVTSIIIRKFVFSQKERTQEMLSCWSMDGFPVGPCLLSYASRLAYEANKLDNLGKSIVSDSLPKLKDSQVPLLKFHVKDCHNPLNSNQKCFETFDSLSELDRELVAKLIDDVFIAYKCFLSHLKTTFHNREGETTLSKLLLSDLISCSKWKGMRLKYLCQSLFSHLPDLSVGEEGIIRLLMSCLDDGDILDVKFDIGLRRYSLFGENTEAILSLIKTSLKWESLEQHKFWGLLGVELAVSGVRLEKLILNFFCSAEINDPSLCSTAVGGLLSICNSRAPTPELVGAVILLPNHVFQAFAAAVLSTWAHLNASLLFDSLAEFSEKHGSQNGESIFSNPTGVMVNHSAILWLLNYFDARGVNLSYVLGGS
ncbi:integrator complex subunit 3-like isoform X2 [Punica granatum]|uniref:Integrator complex subunit 3-like isoform X2 n=1 Tax=Punica granatum TaxID=22663 RepID=A0A6P8CUY2_PUNGR|nr:integrator complex subunit 3-like isoform X2 [Punica granatum]